MVKGYPRHIAVIMDGNRRYAEQCRLPITQGHILGYQRLELFLKWCKEFGIREVTLYVLSINNLKRDKIEVEFLFNLLKEKLQELKDKPQKDVQIRFIGDRELLPKDIQWLMADIENKKRARYTLNLAIAYDGRDEIIRAINRIKGPFDESLLFNNLDLPSSPDLIIRTGGTRLSGFLLWQSSYSELIFLPETLWPGFQKREFKECLEEYKKRRRTHGL